jgi:hypothetical protein
VPVSGERTPPPGLAHGVAADVLPGRWLGGVTMVVGPLLLLAGVLLRAGTPFFFPYQLAAFEERPSVIVASYSLFVAGNVLLWPAVLVLAKRISATRPILGVWGGAMTVFGLFARTFHAGMDHFAFQLAGARGSELATEIIADTYGPLQIDQILLPLHAAIFFGWIVLALGAYRAGILRLLSSVLLGLMAGLPQGVLKGTRPFSIIAAAGLCVALVPLGVKVLHDGPRPQLGAALGWTAVVLAVLAVFTLVGRLG